MDDAGADIIDVGGESTRPGSAPVAREDEQARILTQAKQQKVVLGIRPENIQDSVLAVNPSPHSLIKARVEVVEPMGAEIFVYLAVGSHSFIARMDGHQKIGVNQELSLVFDMETASYFTMEGDGPRIA